MICCNNKKKLFSKIESVKRNSKLLTEFLEEINDEAMTLYQTPNCQIASKQFQYSVESNRFQANSISRSLERIINPIPKIIPRKSSFKVFNIHQTNPQTKFLATKKGYTLLVTHLQSN